MKIKRFEAPTIQEAIKQVKETLGPEAVILSVKEIKKGKGLLGLFSKGVEVTAAIDTPLSTENPPFNQGIQPNLSDMEKNLSVSEKGKEKKDKLEITSNVPSIELLHNLKQVNQEIKRLRMLLETFLPAPPKGEKKELGILDFCRQLKHNGLSQEIALKLMEAFREGVLTEGINEDITLRDFLFTLLKSLIKVSPPLEDAQGDQKIVSFIGTTGTGKTTTLAKIAARILKANKKVIAITIDPRLPGREQLRFYARTLDFPIEIVTSPKELAKAIEKNSDKDVILIDTAGSSPYNEFHIKELQRYFRHLSKPISHYLVMEVTAKDEVLLKTASYFEPLSVGNLLFTKLDETESFGSIFNQIVYTGKPLSYFTTGQRVPEDIEIATPERVINLIINTNREEGNGVKRHCQGLQ